MIFMFFTCFKVLNLITSVFTINKTILLLCKDTSKRGVGGLNILPVHKDGCGKNTSFMDILEIMTGD